MLFCYGQLVTRLWMSWDLYRLKMGIPHLQRRHAWNISSTKLHVEYIPIFSTSLGIMNITITMNPTIKPIGLFTRDIMLKGSLIWNKEDKAQKLHYRSFQILRQQQQQKHKCGSQTQGVPHNIVPLSKAPKPTQSDPSCSLWVLPEPCQGFWHWHRHEPG